MHLLLINSYKIRLTGTYAFKRVVQGINNGEWQMKHNEVQELVINLGKVSSTLHSSFHLAQIYLVGPVQHPWERSFHHLISTCPTKDTQTEFSQHQNFLLTRGSVSPSRGCSDSTCEHLQRANSQALNLIALNLISL